MFTFHIDRLYAGWLRVRVGDAHGEHRLAASYLSDALDHLLAALAALAAGDRNARLSWHGEPTEHRWLFAVDPERDVRVRILRFPDSEAAAPDDEGDPLVDTQVPLRELVHPVVAESRALLSRLGEDGYAREWRRWPFPARRLRILERWLAEHPHPE